MARTPTEDDARDQSASSRSASTSTDQGQTTSGPTTRYGFSTPGLDFQDGQADHRQSLRDAEGNGALVRDGIPAGTSMDEDPDRPEHDPPVGPMWLQRLPGES